MKKFVIIVSILLLLSACDKPNVADFVVNKISGSYQKVNQYGRAMDAKTGPWACILDTKTGLLWENKTDDSGMHHSGWTYTFYENDQSRDERESLFRDGSCESSGKGSCTTQALIDKSNQQKLCGQSDWRLPTKQELESLIDSSKPEQLPLIATAMFPHTKTSSYWTSTKDTDGEKVFALNFTDGIGSYYSRKGAFYVRLVHDYH